MDWEEVDIDDEDFTEYEGEWFEIQEEDSLETLFSTISHPSFKRFAAFAYTNPAGYAIRTNENTGKKEMFVAGSRGPQDWTQNFQEYLGSYNDWRLNKQEFLAEVAQIQNVDVIYGHSRGGALVADMPVPLCIQKVGLDAAMVLARNKDMLNLTESGTGALLSTFDTFIARTGRFNVPIDYSPRYPHKVWAV